MMLVVLLVVAIAIVIETVIVIAIAVAIAIVPVKGTRQRALEPLPRPARNSFTAVPPWKEIVPDVVVGKHLQPVELLPMLEAGQD